MYEQITKIISDPKQIRVLRILSEGYQTRKLWCKFEVFW